MKPSTIRAQCKRFWLDFKELGLKMLLFDLPQGVGNTASDTTALREEARTGAEQDSHQHTSGERLHLVGHGFLLL
jgi:hypothetical protein